MARCSIAGFVLLAASVAWGQDRPLRGNRGGPPDPVVAVLDVNQDGIVSADELANAPARIAKLDSDGDGDVSRTELREAIRGLLASRPAPGERSPGGRRRSGPGASGGATALQRAGCGRV